MVYESMKRLALKSVNDLIRVLMENVDDALFDLSEKVDNDLDRTRYFDAMRQIRLKRKGIVENFDLLFQKSFDYLILNKTADHHTSDFDELSLVAQDEVEDRLAIENMISKARPHFEDDLFAIKERLKVVLHRKQIYDDANPLDPKSICDGFHSACEDLDADIEVKIILYKLFDKFVMSNLGNFYRELNDHFIAKGVLPDFDASKERLNHTTRFMTNRIKHGSVEQGSADENLSDELPLASRHDVQQELISPQSQLAEGNLLAMLQQALMPSSVTVPAANSASVMTGMSAVIEGDEGTSNAVSPVAINTDYMTALLSNLQMTNLRSVNEQSANQQIIPVEKTNPQQLKAQLQQQLVTLKQQSSDQATEADNQIIDIISMLFDYFFDDETLPDPIKVLIGRLQIPILKVAIIDKSFFNHKKHPARKLLDSISKASMGWTSELKKEKVLIDKIEEIVEFLLSEFEEDIAVFEKALVEFQQFLDSENQTVEDNQQQLEHQEQQKEQRIKKAQQAAVGLLDKLESKYDFSLEVIDFLQGVWKSVLFNTYLTQGESSDHWINLKKISSTLIWTLIPKHSKDEKIKLLQTLPPLLRALSKSMELIQVEAQQQNLVFQMLVLEHARTVKQTSKNIVTRVDDETIWPEDKMAQALAGIDDGELPSEQVDFLLTEDETGEILIVDNSVLAEEEDSVNEITRTETKHVIRNLEEFTDCIIKGTIHIDEEIIMDSAEQAVYQQQNQIGSDEFMEQAQTLEIGCWVEFMETDSKWLHAKLSWKSNVTGKFVFVNRQGHKVKNITIYGFSTELRSGRAKLIESVSVFDRAINSFMSTLRH